MADPTISHDNIATVLHDLASTFSKKHDELTQEIKNLSNKTDQAMSTLSALERVSYQSMLMLWNLESQQEQFEDLGCKLNVFLEVTVADKADFKARFDPQVAAHQAESMVSVNTGSWR